MRDSILRAVVLVGTATLFITELLSPFHLLTRWPLAAAWLVAMAAWFRFGRASMLQPGT